ncbi:hypothetical protein [Nocardia sp. CA-135398]|uniref:hypothetical protein n=1 Tax=Nocardia sp. CA-135398 TaxID=3239977 RepID=UPI003D97EC93
MSSHDQGQRMSAVLGSVVAVVGTLLGSFTTYRFQRRSALRVENLARSERLRQERMAAYSECAGALADLRRGQVTLWLRKRDSRATAPAYAEADRLGSAAHAARLRLELVSARPEPLVDAAFTRVHALIEAETETDLRAREAAFETAVSAFIQDAAARLLADSAPDMQSR